MNKLVDKYDCYIKLYDEKNIITIKTDLVCYDPEEFNGNVVLASLIDAPAKLDKIRADYKKGILNEVLLNDAEGANVFFHDEFSNFSPSGNRLSFKAVTYNMSKKKFGNLSHLLISRKNNSPYIFKFNEEESINDLVMSKLINIYFVPCKSDLVQEVILNKPEVLRLLPTVTNNEELKGIKVFKFDKDLFVDTLNKLSAEKGEVPDPIFQRFVGDFSGYINYFKPDILENLNSKIEEFYDRDDVPEYVTQFPYPLPNKDMRVVLNKLSYKTLEKEFEELSSDEKTRMYELYKKLYKEGKIKKTETFDPNWSRQYVVWAAGMKMLETERFCYLSTTMGSGKTISALKINKYSCQETLKRKNHLTFILCPQSTITQWIGEVSLIEKGIGHTREDYNIIVIDKTKVLMDFYRKHCKVKKDKIIFDKNTIDKPTYILCGKEAFKLSQVKRPAFNLSFDNQMKPILKCPNCGKPLVFYKKGKSRYEEIREISMNIDDFYNIKNDKATKSLKASNVFCESCVKEINEYEEFMTNERDMKSSFDSYIINQYPLHFIPKDKNLWTAEYNSVNEFRNKIYDKLPKVKDIDDKYTKYKSIEEMKEMFKSRCELRDKMSEKFNLRQLNVSKSNSKKISVVEFLRKRKFEFDSVIIDEAHEGNNANSLIGTAQRLLFRFSKKIILLSGTANNGYASSLHNLLMAAMPKKLIEDGTFEKANFIRKYGIQKGVIKVDEHGKVSGRVDLPNSAFKEVEGINPVVFAKFLSKNFIMVNTLQELDLPMPNLVEKYVPIEADEELLPLYYDFYARTEKANLFMARMLKASVFKNYINNPYNWKPVDIPIDGGSIEVEPQLLDRTRIPYLKKDYELLEIIKKEKSEGRKCFLFTDFAEGGKYINTEEVKGKTKEIKYTINDRICELLKANGITYMVLQANTTSVANRRDFIEEKKDDYDVFICQPQLVNVGLNLVFCPTYIVYTPFYKYDIISQATRRGYRANSTEENRIFHLYYSETCEEDIIDRYQRKLAEAKAIEGEFFVNIEQGKNLRTLSKMSDEIVKN